MNVDIVVLALALFALERSVRFLLSLSLAVLLLTHGLPELQFQSRVHTLCSGCHQLHKPATHMLLACIWMPTQAVIPASAAPVHLPTPHQQCVLLHITQVFAGNSFVHAQSGSCICDVATCRRFFSARKRILPLVAGCECMLKYRQLCPRMAW